MPDRLVTLGLYGSALEAQMDKNLLETSGIDACVVEDYSGTLFGQFLSGVKLLVSEEDALRAELILASVRDKSEPVDEEETRPIEDISTTRTCPTCEQAFDIELRRCPRCAPSEEIFEESRECPPANVAPLAPQQEVKETPNLSDEEYPLRQLTYSNRDRLAKAALNTALLGLCVCPVVCSIISLVYLVRVAAGSEEMRGDSWMNVYVALTLSLAELGVVALVMWNVIRR